MILTLRPCETTILHQNPDIGPNLAQWLPEIDTMQLEEDACLI